jgi:hypothetical protein
VPREKNRIVGQRHQLVRQGVIGIIDSQACFTRQMNGSEQSMKDLNTLCGGACWEQETGLQAASQQALTLCWLLRVAPVPWLQNLNALTAIHPLWFHVRSGLGRFSGWVGRWGR